MYDFLTPLPPFGGFLVFNIYDLGDEIMRKCNLENETGRPQVERMPLGIDTATELCDVSETVGIFIQIDGTDTSWAD